MLVDLDDPTNLKDAISKMESYLEEVANWMTYNKLRLNANKTIMHYFTI